MNFFDDDEMNSREMIEWIWKFGKAGPRTPRPPTVRASPPKKMGVAHPARALQVAHRLRPEPGLEPEPGPHRELGRLHGDDVATTALALGRLANGHSGGYVRRLWCRYPEM